jgi:hypothetical protein
MVIQAVGDSTIMVGTTKGNYYVSHDRGHNWSISNIGISPITQGITLLSFKDRYNGLVAQTVGTVVLRETHDGGASWQTVTPTGPFRSGTLCYVPGTENTFVSANYRSIGASGASYSFDGGHSWSQFLGTEDQVYTYCQFVNNHCGWSGSIVTSANADGMYKFIGTLDPSAMFRPVMDLSAQTQINTVHLSWNEPITNPIEYKIYRNDTLILTTNSLHYDDLQVANGQQNYCVVAVYDIGESVKSCATAWITVGINNPEDLAYKVYPNPSNGILNIETPFTFKEIRLLNSLGQVVYRNPVSGKNLQILTEGFDPGMYFLQVYTENKVVTSKVAISR